ncbi:uncharacterized protein LY89DRAFT_692617 [Mollisia scopiformis]|uniref:Uncharacterized protein n=1 Tax=Mollisia scopiformis TaxID=149040 RepID=A0A132B1L6_MOLSC|nr:uncharacterized protein LY89DRAFT_692617 [Mollisia scopiformis]KUJ06278.1 hypothetical protein LY89DRAFT_692617 [Mollisia scopiformis]
MERRFSSSLLSSTLCCQLFFLFFFFSLFSGPRKLSGGQVSGSQGSDCAMGVAG